MRRLLVVLLALLFGCQQSPAARPAPVGSLTLRLKQEGDALTARGDYEAAAVAYQSAANQEPEDISLRFALGAALSHLGRRKETVEQFRFVVAKGRPDSTEVQAAQRWLIAAGELDEPVAFAPSRTPRGPAVSPSPAPTATTRPGSTATGKVSGRIEARGGQAREVNLSLIGDGGQETAISQTLNLGESFEFDKVPPGNYRLALEDRETGDQLWDVPVTVTASGETVQDLTAANRK